MRKLSQSGGWDFIGNLWDIIMKLGDIWEEKGDLKLVEEMLCEHLTMSHGRE